MLELTKVIVERVLSAEFLGKLGGMMAHREKVDIGVSVFRLYIAVNGVYVRACEIHELCRKLIDDTSDEGMPRTAVMPFYGKLQTALIQQLHDLEVVLGLYGSIALQVHLLDREVAMVLERFLGGKTRTMNELRSLLLAVDNDSRAVAPRAVYALAYEHTFIAKHIPQRDGAGPARPALAASMDEPQARANIAEAIELLRSGSTLAPLHRKLMPLISRYIATAVPEATLAPTEAALQKFYEVIKLNFPVDALLPKVGISMR